MDGLRAGQWRASRLFEGDCRGFAAKVPVGEQVAALEALNTKYTDFINESRMFVDTVDITKADAKRDALFMAIYTAVDYLAARRRRACARRRPPSLSRSSLGSTRRRGSFRRRSWRARSRR